MDTFAVKEWETHCLK
ncbi:hypothetical protein OFN30_30990 [Escherichia coli]|nr:hypothetical protein [Escherichia coli]